MTSASGKYIVRYAPDTSQYQTESATVRVGARSIVILPDGGVPPPGSLVFLRFQDCDFTCEDVASWEDYHLERAVG